MSAESSRTASPSPVTPRGHLSPSGSGGHFAPHDHAAPGPSSRQALNPLAADTNGPSSSSAPQSHPPRLYNLHPGCSLCTFLSTAKDRIQARTQWAADTPERQQPQRARSPSPLAGFVPFSPTSPSITTSSAPRAPETLLEVDGREIVHWDENVVIYKATRTESLCAAGRHLIVVLNRHLGGVYDLGPSDIPTLSHILETTRRILGSTSPSLAEQARPPAIRVGFVGSVVRDPNCPQGHLHAHALGGPVDPKLPGASFYRRNVVFSGVNWWGLEDLRAEIRESTSNNRIKSGYANRTKAPIDRVPDAGSVAGYPNAMVADPYVDTPKRGTKALDSQIDPKIDRKGKGALRPLRAESHSNTHSRTSSTSSAGSSTTTTARKVGDDYDAIDLGDTPVKSGASGARGSGGVTA